MANWGSAEGEHSSDGLKTGEEIEGVQRTAYVCGFMYAAIGLAWWLASRVPKEHPRTAHMQITLHCITWSSTSVGMQMLNKSLVTVLKAPALISAAQMVISCVVIAPSAMGKLMRSDSRQLLLWLIVPVLFSGLILSSFYAYEYVSLSLLTVVRNLSPMVVLPIELLVMPPSKQPRISTVVLLSMVMMIVGVVVYKQGITGFSIVGVLFAVGNMMLAVIEMVLQRRLLVDECKDLTSGVITLVTNAFGAFPCLGLAYLTGELAQLPANTETWSNPEVLSVLIMSGIVGLGIGYLGFETQRAISASSFMVLQSASKTSVIALGIVMFGDPAGPIPILGIVLSLLGSLIYGHAQIAHTEDEEKLLFAKSVEEVDETQLSPNVDPDVNKSFTH